MHRFESLAAVVRPVADCGELFEVASDLTAVPGAQDCFDVCARAAQGIAGA